MATVQNPRKSFNFRIDFPSPRFLVNSFFVQQVTLPDSEAEVVSHGDVNFDVKTAGRRTVSNLVIKKLLSADVGDTNNMNLWLWHNSCQNFGVGSVPPTAYKMDMSIIEFAQDGLTRVNQWEFRGVWPCKINGQEHDRMSSDNTIESVEFAIDEMVKVP